MLARYKVFADFTLYGGVRGRRSRSRTPPFAATAKRYSSAIRPPLWRPLPKLRRPASSAARRCSAPRHDRRFECRRAEQRADRHRRHHWYIRRKPAIIPLSFPLSLHRQRQQDCQIEGWHMTDEQMLQRCAWAGNDPLMQAYHDQEWGVPERDGRALWEKLMLDGFQAGPVVAHDPAEARRLPPGVSGLRPGGRGALRRGGCGAAARRSRHRPLARQDRGDDRQRPRLPRDGRRPARIFRPLFGTWPAARRSGTHWQSMGDLPAKTPLSEAISAALKKRGFKFVGPVIVYAWMQATGIVDDHVVGCFRRDLNQ